MLNISNGQLLCPQCGDTYVHLDDVYVAGRPREGGDVVPVRVDSHGRVSTPVGPVPTGKSGLGDRHSLSLAGYCEACSAEFALVFTQRKGNTLVDVVMREWNPNWETGPGS